jgi:O-antigen ligase
VLRIVTVPNDTLVLALLSPVCLAIFAADGSRWHRAIALATLLLSAAAIVVAQSRLGILTMIIAQMVSGAAMRQVRPWWALAMMGAAVAALAADASSGFALLHKLLGAQSESRIGLWWAAAAMFLDAPMLGHGPGTFGALRLPFVASFPATHAFGVEARYVPWPHNVFLELLAERGALAFAGFSLALAGAVNAALIARHSQSAEIRMAAAALLGALAALVFGGLTELSMLHLWVPVVGLTLFGLAAMLEQFRKGEL